jgi:hypothetical protein
MADKETKSTLEFLYNVSRELASALELRQVLQRILFQSLKYVGGERASVVVLDDTGKAIDSAIVYGRKIHDHTTQQLRETVERGLAGWSCVTVSRPGCPIPAATNAGCVDRMTLLTSPGQKPPCACR